MARREILYLGLLLSTLASSCGDDGTSDTGVDMGVADSGPVDTGRDGSTSDASNSDAAAGDAGDAGGTDGAGVDVGDAASDAGSDAAVSDAEPGDGATGDGAVGDGGVGDGAVGDGGPDAGTCTDNADCDDGAFCNGAEICNAGICANGVPLNCADIDACTADSCDEANDVCSNVFDPACTVCSTDQFEPNDSFATAVATSTGSFTALYACLNNEDWHTLTVGNNELIEVLVSFQDAIGDINMRLYRADGSQVAASVSGSDDEQIVYTATTGTYRLLVDFNDTSGDDDDIPGNRYTMDVALGTPCTDRFEDDDAMADATPLGTGTEAGLTACPYDDDWTAVTVGDNQLILASALFEDSEGDVDLRLYNAAGQQVAVSLSSSDDEHLAYTAPSAGTYFLRTILNAGRDDVVPGVDYDLVIDLDSACTDFLENNDSQATSSNITDGTYALNSCPSDDDWFRFSAQSNDVIDIDLTFDSAKGNIDIRLYDVTGAQIATSLSGSDNEAITFTAPYDGPYFARVLLPGPDDVIPGNDYTMTIDTQTRCTDDYEDNDGLSRAYDLGAGSFPNMRACPADEDWYEIPVSVAGVLDAQLTFLDADGNIDARLYDPTGAQVATSLSGSDNESITYSVPAPGVYALRVALVGDDTVPGNDYALVVAGADACAPTSCAAQGAQCGDIHDGCGGTLTCGTCPTGGCSGNNLCGCTPDTCVSLSANCGLASDGCGGTLNCGACTAPELCGGAYVSNVCAAPTCVDDGLEDNDIQANASALASGVTPDLVSCPADDDYYSIPLSSNDVLIATAMFDDIRGNLDLRLYDANGSQVDASLSGSNDERVVYTAAAAGTYALRAIFAGSDDEIPGVDYSMSIQTAVCTDAYEDSDNQANAALLVPGTYASLTACPHDDDWYRVALANNEILDVTANFIDGAGNIDLRLYNDAGQQVGTSLSGSDDEQIVYAAPASGDYFVRVIFNEGDDDATPGNDYSLVIALDSSCVDALEDNDTRLTSAPIVAGNYTGLTVCPADDDWFSFSAPDNGVIIATTTFTHSQGNIDLRFYDARGSQFATSLSGNDDERIAFTAPSAGTFHLRAALVNDFGTPGNGYTLDLSTATICTDVFENNDTRARAYDLGAGSFAALTACPADEDWYALDLTQGATLDIGLTFTTSLGNIDLRLYDPTGQQVATALSGSDNETLSYAVPTTGTYHARVVLVQDDLTPGNAYAMTISGAAPCTPTISCASAMAQCGPLHDGCGNMLDCGNCGGPACSPNNICGCVPDTCVSLGLNCGTPDDGCGAPLNCGDCVLPELCDGAYMEYVCAPPSCPQDALEDNDTRQTAPEITSGTYEGLTICPGDDDWYELDLGNNVVISSRFEFDGSKGNVDMRLYNASGSQLDTSLSGNSDEFLQYTTPAAGTYFVRATIVGTDDAIPGNRYRFILDATQQCVDGFEDNDRSVDAIVLGTGSYASLTACPNDEDWYEMTLGNNELIEIDLDFVDSLGNIDMRLYDAAGQQIATSLSGSDDERIVYTALQAGVYRLRVVFIDGADDQNAGNDYNLSLDLGVPCTDAFEDNETLLTAGLLPLGPTAGLTSCPADEDWYQIDIAANRRLIADATFTHATGNIDLRLYDGTGAQLATSLSGSDNEQINYVTPGPGPFFLRAVLVGDDGTPGNDYALNISDTVP